MKFSVIVPTYNYGNFVREALESLLQQNFNKKEYEIIIVDDCSTDNTEKIIEKYLKQKHSKFPKIKYIQKKKNEGTAASYSAGIKVAKGEITCILDADDLWKPNKLAIIEKFLLQKDADLVFHGSEIIDKNGKTIAKKLMIKPKFKVLENRSACIKEVIKKSFFGPLGSTMCIKTKILKNITIPAEVGAAVDGYIFLSVILTGGKIYFINKRLSLYRSHSGSTTYALNINKAINNLNNFHFLFLHSYKNYGKKYRFLYKLSEMNLLRKKILIKEKVNKLKFQYLLFSLLPLIGLKKFIRYSLLNLSRQGYLKLREKFLKM